jgi:hypothetical protein
MAGAALWAAASVFASWSSRSRCGCARCKASPASSPMWCMASRREKRSTAPPLGSAETAILRHHSTHREILLQAFQRHGAKAAHGCLIGCQPHDEEPSCGAQVPRQGEAANLQDTCPFGPRAFAPGLEKAQVVPSDSLWLRQQLARGDQMKPDGDIRALYRISHCPNEPIFKTYAILQRLIGSGMNNAAFRVPRLRDAPFMSKMWEGHFFLWRAPV